MRLTPRRGRKCATGSAVAAKNRLTPQIRKELDMKHQSSPLTDQFRLEILRQMIGEYCWTKYVPRKKMKTVLTPSEYDKYVDDLRQTSLRVPAPPDIRRALQKYTKMVAVGDKLQHLANKGYRVKRLRKPRPGVPNQRSLQDQAYAAYLKAYEFLEELYEQFPDIELWLDRKACGDDSGETCEHIPRTIWSRSGLAQTRPAQSRSTITRDALMASRNRLLGVHHNLAEGHDECHSPASANREKGKGHFLPLTEFDELPLLTLNWPE